MDKFVRHEVDYMKILYDSPDVSIYELDALYTGENPNGLVLSKECIEKSLSSFADKPLYGVIDNQFNPLDGSNNDFMEHFREEYPWRITRDRILPFGCVPESGLKDAKFVDRDGHTYLRINTVVWKRLLPHVSEILQRRDGEVKVSVEFEILSGEQDDTGLVYVDEFRITAITALGEKFREVMEGSRLKTIRFSYDEYAKNGNQRYCSFSEEHGMKIPSEVLNAMNEGIKMREQYGRGGNKAVYESIKTISNIGSVFKADVVNAQNYFATLSNIPEKTSPVTGKYILYSMYGGEAGREFFNSLDCNGSAVTIKNSSKGGSSEVNIQIDNKKEAAINGQSWDNPGKSLYGPIMEASNKASLVKEAYLVVEDGWEDAPSEHLKYPHHEVKDGKLVLNVAGVKAAFARASQQDIVNGAVKKHLERHYRELGLSMDNFEAKCAELQEKCDKLNADYEAKCAELEAKCAELDKKCAEFEASDTACKAAEQKCADLNAQLEEKCAKLAEFEKKETVACNMAMIDEYCGCFDAETLNALKEKAGECDCDEMKAAVSEAVMAFAKSAVKQDGAGAEHKFSFGFPEANPFYKATASQQSDLARVTSKSKTKVI